MCSTHGPNSQTGGPRCGGASRSASIEAVLPVKLSAEALGLGEGSGVSHLLRRTPFGVPIRQARFASRRARATSQIGSVDTNVATPRSWIQRATAEWRSRREAGLASRGGGSVVGRTTAPRLSAGRSPGEPSFPPLPITDAGGPWPLASFRLLGAGLEPARDLLRLLRRLARFHGPNRCAVGAGGTLSLPEDPREPQLGRVVGLSPTCVRWRRASVWREVGLGSEGVESGEVG